MNKKLKILFVTLLGFATACDPDKIEPCMYGVPQPKSQSIEADSEVASDCEPVVVAVENLASELYIKN